MKNMALLYIFYILLIAGSAFGSDFEKNTWPGEGIPNFSARNDFLNLYSQPTTTSPQIKYNLQKGSKIVFDKSKLKMKKSKRETEKIQGTAVQSSTVYFDESKLITKQSVTLTAIAEVTDVHCENSTGKKKIIMPDGAEGIMQRGAIVISPGETIEFLQYRAEGYITARYKGSICEVFVMDNIPKFDGLEKQPVVEWWIHVVNKDKISQGWLLVDKSQVNFLERGF